MNDYQSMRQAHLARYPVSNRIGTRVTLGGQTVMTSANLAAVCRYASKSPVNVVSIRELPNGMYGVGFFYDNGAECLTAFADWRVALTWLAARRSWSVNRLSIDEKLYDKARQEGRLRWFHTQGTIVTMYPNL